MQDWSYIISGYELGRYKDDHFGTKPKRKSVIRSINEADRRYNYKGFDNPGVAVIWASALDTAEQNAGKRKRKDSHRLFSQWVEKNPAHIHHIIEALYDNSRLQQYAASEDENMKDMLKWYLTYGRVYQQ